MTSSNLARRGHASRVFVSVASEEAGGLRLDSVIMTDNLATAFDNEFNSLLRRLPDMAAIDLALKYTSAL
jgi:hypothetical protein